MKIGTLLLVLLVVALGLIAAAAVSVLHDGLSSRAKPSALETAIARSARKMAAPSGAHNTRNPVPDSAEVQREARLHFADHCAICHGNDGSGETMLGSGLYPKPPDLRAEETQKLSDGDIFWIIENGVRLTGMPAFGGTGSEHDHDVEDTWKLVHFIRHLPALSAEEKLQMEKYNPKNPDDRREEQEENNFLDGGAAKPAVNPGHHHH
jgi:mono/diheme cytochrome c family protein